MARILIVYHSQTGNTEKMAMAVAAGARGIEKAEVILKKAGDATLEDLLQADGLAIGTPENFGYMSGMIKDFFDRTYVIAQDKVFRKPYVVFISAGNDVPCARPYAGTQGGGGIISQPGSLAYHLADPPCCPKLTEHRVSQGCRHKLRIFAARAVTPKDEI